MRNLYACLMIPDFAAAVLLRGERNRRTPPVAVFTGTPPNCFVYTANEPARQGGVREGMPLAEAVARYGLARDSRFAGKPQSPQTSRRPLRDEVKGKGIKPYRLRPTAPVETGAAACPSPQSGEARDAARTSSQEPATTSAHAQLPHLQTRERSPEAEQLAQQELIEMALTVSPRVEDAASGLLIVDLAGMPDPHGSATQLAHGAEKLGLPANVGVSANRFVAIAAARTQPGVTHIFPGQEAGFLSVLPVDTLPLAPREQEVFARWGLHTVGDLARLPEDSLVARFGTRGSQLSQLARGQQDAVMRPFEPPPALEEKSDLDWQIIELEPLAFLLSGLLERLCLKLQGHNLAAAEIRLALKLADGSRYERAVAMSHPLADPRTLLTLLRIDLAAHPPGDAIEGVTVAAQPAPRRLTQFSLFDPALPSPEKLAVTLARLTHLVGPGRVGAPVVPDTHRPGAFGVEVFRVEIVARACPPPGNGEARWQPLDNSELRLPAASQHKEARATQHAPPAPRCFEAAEGGPTRRTIPVAPQSSLPATDAETRVAPATTAGSVLVFPESEDSQVKRQDQPPQDPMQPDAAAGDAGEGGIWGESSKRYWLGLQTRVQAKVVVFPSPFRGEARAAVSATSAARRASAEYSVVAASTHESTDQPISRSTAQSTAQSIDLSRRAHAFRCFRPSAEAEVLLRGRLPVYVDSFEVRGPVRAHAGPWQVCGEWWAEGWQYEEWDVEVNGRLYRICCELPTRQWFVTGAYD
jgi:nucleotidyltransferase/DNA polymerase involved in DNA repair